ncbi:MAG: hypothetical protein M1833_000995 [Piccolia ochrophora]|nr:MAG: hypothetical protein M1833_000995 [Piccolia ochrophora]
MLSDAPGGAPSNAAPAKPSLFNRPSWSRTTPTTEKADLFSRSKDIYADIVKQQEEERRKKHVQKVRDRMRKCGGGDEDGDEGREGKRRRVDDQDADDDEDKNRRPTTVKFQTSPSRSLSKSYEQTVTTGRLSPTGGPSRSQIALSDEDDDDEELTITKTIEPPPEDDDPESDEEFRELARRARERAKARDASAAATPPVPSPTPTSAAPPAHDPSTSTYTTSATLPTQRPPTPEPPIVSIFITSSLPNTKPLIVQRRIHQRLKDVRIAWCAKQGFNETTTRAVFLTWRGKRLFDVTTCKALGVDVDDQGDLLLHGQSSLGDGRVHMVATTEEVSTEEKRGRERSGVPDADNGVSDNDDDEAAQAETQPKPDPDAPQPDSSPTIRIVLKSPGFRDFGLHVKLVCIPSPPSVRLSCKLRKISQTTKISHIVSAFRQAFHLPVDKEAYVVFDGDRLDPADTVAGVDMGDLDGVEVHVK